MPLHDYSHCGVLLTDIYRSVEEGAQRHPPPCPVCGAAMAWIPQVGSMDAYEPFQEFETYDGQNRKVLIDSFSKLRKLEAESERQYKNGEGQPLNFRRWSQDRSNRDVSALHASWDGGEQPSPEAKRRFGGRALAAEPEVRFGPGVHEGNCSGLEE